MHNSCKIQSFENLHKDRLCIVAGSSPSLRHINVEKMHAHIVISVNSSILKLPKAKYFVSDDSAIMSWNYWAEVYKNKDCIKFLYADKFAKLVPTKHDIVFYEHRQYATASQNGLNYHLDNLAIEADSNVPIIGARSSIATAINIAYIMGCNPIVIVGHDCCYEDDKRYFWQFDGQPRAVVNNNRFFSKPNHGQIDGRPVDSHCVDYILYWNHFAKVNPDLCNGRILDASMNSVNKIFPKVEIDSILDEFGDQNV